MNWQPGQEYQTRDGRRARVYAVDGGMPWPVHGAVMTGGEWTCLGWHVGGEILVGSVSNADLMPPPPVKHVLWVNVYDNYYMAPWTEKRLADNHAGDRIACLRIEFEEGEGL